MSNLPARICGALFLVAAIAAANPAQSSKGSLGSSNHETPQRSAAANKRANLKPPRPENGPAKGGSTAGEPITSPVPSQDRSGDEPLPKPDRDREAPVIADHPQIIEAASWATNPFVVAPLALVVLIAVGLHFVHISTQSRMKQDMTAISRDLERLSETAGKAASKHEVDSHGKSLASLRSDLDELNDSVSAARSEIGDAADALILTAEWIGNSMLRDVNRASRQDAEGGKALVAAGRHKEVFTENANRISEAAAALDRLIALLKSRPASAAGFVARLEALRENVRQFKRWEFEVDRRLRPIEGGDSDDSSFRSRKDGIAAELKAGRISAAVYVQRHRDLIESRLPGDPGNRLGPARDSDNEQYFASLLAGVTDYLMDWFDRLYQLYYRVNTATDPSIDAEIRREFSRVQKIAKEAMARFDIQLEEVEIGQTGFDRRLHDAALVMQASGSPANIIIGVQQCGFRRLSTGDVLRRPKVVVSGNGAGPVKPVGGL